MLNLTECRTNADVSFVLDSSGSINIERDNYQTVKEFVYNFTKELEIGPDRNRVSVTIFGNNGSVVFGLHQYSGKTQPSWRQLKIYHTLDSGLTQQMDCAKF